jgi:hypothetical protein
MADIYASARLTIVAAAGEDADHGLPAVHEPPSDRIPYAIAGSIFLLPYPVPLRKEVLSESKWSTRAWTYQECFFARRRLFFTGTQIKYGCNRELRKSLPVGWIPSFPMESSEAYIYPHTGAKDMISAYTGRHLTYESDALAAIIGALNSLQDKTLRHIWGFPLNCLSDGVFLPLLWQHRNPCARRTHFPSWSPIAWTGQAVWLCPDIKNVDGIRVLKDHNGTSITLRALGKSHDDYESAPRYFKITAEMGRLRLIRTSVSVGKEKDVSEGILQGTFLAIPLDDNKEFILHEPAWDVEPSTLPLDLPILGILFRFGNHYGPVILLVRLHDQHYERVGILRLQSALNYCIQEVLHESRYLRFFRTDTGEFWHHDVGDLEGINDLDVKDTKFPIWHESNWQSNFIADTIMLG